MDKARSSSKAAKFDDSGKGALLKYFLIWKALLIAAACASPGPGYDTSTQILFEQYEPPASSSYGRAIEYIVLRLTRWDGIYFASNSARGHVNEQNWAFSWALARSTSFLSRVLFSSLSLSPIVKDALTGILISNLSHLIAVVALYEITFNIIPSSQVTKRRIAFIASCLHIISPGGLFLSAPSGESAFAALSFVGTLSYTLAVRERFPKEPNAAKGAILTITAGFFCGLATMIRGNGILGGMLFAADVIMPVLRPADYFQDPRRVTTFAATIFAGMLVAAGFAGPQVVAYMEYCTGDNTRPWCEKLIPSIYSWVQDHYWKVGFMKYWTMNNLPLFLLAGPMLVIMGYTGYVGLMRFGDTASMLAEDPRSKEEAFEKKVFEYVIQRIANQQCILAMLAFFSFHVQIINRISSGYPAWYIILAIALHCSSNEENMSRNQKHGSNEFDPVPFPKKRHMQWVVRGMVMYAIIQDGLYASFLPPA